MLDHVPDAYTGQWNFACELMRWDKVISMERQRYILTYLIPYAFQKLPIRNIKKFCKDETMHESLLLLLQEDEEISSWQAQDTEPNSTRLFDWWVLNKAILVKISRFPQPPINKAHSVITGCDKAQFGNEADEDTDLEFDSDTATDTSDWSPESTVSNTKHQQSAEESVQHLTKNEIPVKVNDIDQSEMVQIRDSVKPASETIRGESQVKEFGLEQSHIQDQEQPERGESQGTTDTDTILSSFYSEPKNWHKKAILIKMLDGKVVLFMVRAQAPLQGKDKIEFGDITHQIFMDCIRRQRGGKQWPSSWRIVYNDSVYGGEHNLADLSGFLEGGTMFEVSPDFEKGAAMTARVQQIEEPVHVDLESEAEVTSVIKTEKKRKRNGH